MPFVGTHDAQKAPLITREDEIASRDAIKCRIEGSSKKRVK